MEMPFVQAQFALQKAIGNQSIPLSMVASRTTKIKNEQTKDRESVYLEKKNNTK